MLTLAAAGLIALLACPSVEASVTARQSIEKVDGIDVEVYQACDDARPGPRPGVLVFHYTLEGVTDYVKLQARKLAEQGYVVMAPTLAVPADFEGVKDARDLNGEQFQRYQSLITKRSRAALKLLRGDSRVNAPKIGIVGYCHLGGVLAMNMARTGAEVAGVAALWGGVSPKDISPMWARQRIKPKILVMLGGSDAETTPYLASFHEEMRLGQADWRLALYGKASHGFTVPGPHPDHRGEYDPEADRLSWIELTNFLADLFKTPAAPAP